MLNLLEQANIVCTGFALSSDYPHSLENINGVRFGTSTVSRLGMSGKEMRKISQSIGEVLHHPERADRIGRDVSEMAKQFAKVHYSFDIERSQ